MQPLDSSSVSESSLYISRKDIESIVNNAVNDLKKEISKLSDIIKRQDDELRAKEKRIECLETKLSQVEVELNNSEQYSRKNSLRINGLSVPANTSITDTVIDFFGSKLNLTFDQSSFCAVHFVNTFKSSKSLRKPPIIVKLVRTSDKIKIIKERRRLKGSSFTIQEDMTKKNVLLLNRVRNSDGVEDAWFTNGRVFCKRGGRKFPVSLLQSVHDAAQANARRSKDVSGPETASRGLTGCGSVGRGSTRQNVASHRVDQSPPPQPGSSQHQSPNLTSTPA